MIGAGGCASEPTRAQCPPSRFRSDVPLVIAHAGGEGLGPSNTILAMERSVAAGADVLDVDVWMSSDGVIVTRHDRDVATTTGGTGNVDELTWSQLQLLDTRVGWTGEEISEPVRIPSLEDVVSSFPQMRISIEIKQPDPLIATRLCEVLEATDSIDRVYVSSVRDDEAYATRAACPRVTITTTDSDVVARRAAREEGVAWCAPSPIGQPRYRAERFTPEEVQRSHDSGLAIYTWTIDDPDTLLELARAGVDGVYTRRPDIARMVFDQFAESG